MTIDGRFGFGVVGGLGALAGADVLQRLIRTIETGREHERYAVVFEQQSFPGDAHRADAHYDPTARKLHAFSVIRRLETRGVDAILLPCFISHTFIDEIAPNVSTPIVDLMVALRAALESRYARVRRIGILTSDYVCDRALFERVFADHWEVAYPSAEAQALVMDAVYGEHGIKSGRSTLAAIDALRAAASELVGRGCDAILPGFTELSLVLPALASRVACPVLDANQCYVEHALTEPIRRPRKAFKIGVVGGVGPLATVDFMAKVVRVTEARRDQDHIKMIVEQNPQIPDRTEHLVHGGTDPTIALFAACKKLEAADADLIAIPCNTAHAFVERIQPHLRIPVLNMLDETMAQIAARFPGRTVGLLATSGTVQSGVYAKAAERAGITMIVPDAMHQARVMGAIFGSRGVKAGYTEGECRDDLLAAVRHLTECGAQVVILGCTELPLILQQDERFAIADRSIALLDPTMLLAAACVRHARVAQGAGASGLPVRDA
jgi:aspartate racemase